MTKRCFRRVGWPLSFAAALLGAAPASAQQGLGFVPGDVNERLDRLEKLNELLLKQNQELKQELKEIKSQESPVGTGVQPVDIQNIVTQYLQQQGDQTKPAPNPGGDAEKGFVVGRNLGMTASWTGHQPWVETADKSFRIHFGGRTQFDFVGVGAPENVKFGTGGIGDYENAVNFRRARLEMDGWIYECIDFFCEYDFINTFNFNTNPDKPGTFRETVANTPAPTDLWMSINYIPWIGSIRIGNMKNPIGLDHLTSSRYLDFLERSHGFDTFYNRNNGFTQGIMLFNATENERMQWQVGLFKYTNPVFAWNVGDSEYMVTGRITGLPWYKDNGRYMVHLGLGAQWGNPDENNAVLRNRVMARNGPAALHTTTAFASLTTDNQTIINPEFFMNLGPLSIQAEYVACVSDDISFFQTQLQPKQAGGGRRHFSQSAYVQAMYFLTGEHRPYGKTTIHGSGAAPTRVVPHRNYFFVRGEDCGHILSCGAWQVGARYSYVDLTNNGILGGDVHELTLGLNWFLNPNLKIQFNYDIGHRNVPGSTSSGNFHAYGMRMALDW